MKNKSKMIVGLVVLLGAFGYFAFMAFENSMVYYYTVGELQQRGPSEPGETLRVNGKLVPGSFAREPDSVLARFTLSDGPQQLSAIHSGVVPDLFFSEQSQIILEGYYSPDRVFLSENVIVKCPSKYIAAE